MIALLDTHSFLWTVMAPDKLSASMRGAIADPGNEIHVSTVSFWEIALKFSLGKLRITGCSPEDLVGYSFHALEAWAGDRDRSRREDETAIEFSNRLGEQFAWLRQDANKLSNLVARMVYAGGNLPKNTKDTLDHFWDRLTSGAVEEGIDEEAQIVE